MKQGCRRLRFGFLGLLLAGCTQPVDDGARKQVGKQSPAAEGSVQNGLQPGPKPAVGQMASGQMASGQIGTNTTQTTISSGSAGCHASSPQIGVNSLAITISGDSRSYVLSVDGAYQADKPHALVFGWHGLGLDGAQMRSFVKDIEALAGDEAIFVYPDAGGRAWSQDEGGPDVALFDQLVQSLGETYCIDESRIFSIGFSDGAFFTNFMGQTRAQKIRAIVPVSGGGGGGALMPALVVHGKDDPNVGAENGIESAKQWARSDGCQEDIDENLFDVCQPLAGCKAGYPVAFCYWTKPNPGWVTHDWPRFSSANQDIWQFFAQFQ